MLKSFLQASEELGKNFTLIQGAGGNTSCKEGNWLFVKASGYKLKDSLNKDIFVKVNLLKLKDRFFQRKKVPLEGTWDELSGKRPSMETYMHAILPHKYIFHVHCLNTISYLVQKNFEIEISNIFNDIKFSIIKYKKPGLPLANEIQKVIANENPDVLFLANHGLVVGANNIDKALNLIYYISKSLERSLSIKNNENSERLDYFAKDSIYRPTIYKEAHNIAFSNHKTKIASFGSLYPDHVVFLGPASIVLKKKSEINKIIESENLQRHLPILIIPKAGILVPNNISSEAEELVLALSKIVSYIPNNKEVNYLTNNEEYELRNSNSENYRLILNSKK